MPVASLTKEGFAIFRANDFEARRNGFHAEEAEKDGQVPIARSAGTSVTRSIECQQSSHVLVRCYRQDVKQHKFIAMVCSKLLTFKPLSSRVRRRPRQEQRPSVEAAVLLALRGRFRLAPAEQNGWIRFR
jgi:hypothetical protein